MDILSTENGGQINSTELMDPMTVLTAITFTTGSLMLVMGIIQFGLISFIFTDNLISGFTTAAAFHVATSQLDSMLDLNLSRKRSPFKLIYIWLEVFKNLNNINRFTALLSSFALILLLIVKEVIEPRFKKAYNSNIPIPVDLFLIVFTTVVSNLLNFKSSFGIKIMGYVPSG